jgi:hypothetical protein
LQHIQQGEVTILARPTLGGVATQTPPCAHALPCGRPGMGPIRCLRSQPGFKHSQQGCTGTQSFGHAPPWAVLQPGHHHAGALLCGRPGMGSPGHAPVDLGPMAYDTLARAFAVACRHKRVSTCCQPCLNLGPGAGSPTRLQAAGPRVAIRSWRHPYLQDDAATYIAQTRVPSQQQQSAAIAQVIPLRRFKVRTHQSASHAGAAG